MSESNNNKNLVVVVLALFVFLIGIYLTKTLPGNEIKETQEPQKESVFDTDLQRAQSALEAYYSLLANQDYINANNYHGSGYDYILSLNPTVDEDNHTLLLEIACESNGFICMEISEVVSSEMDVEGTYSFTVKFKTKDGELLVLPAMEVIGQKEIIDHTITVMLSGNTYIVTTPLIFYP